MCSGCTVNAPNVTIDNTKFRKPQRPHPVTNSKLSRDIDLF